MLSYVQARELLVKRFMPMVIPPAPWTAQLGGGYLLWRCHVMRTRAKQQHDLIAQAEADNPFALHRVRQPCLNRFCLCCCVCLLFLFLLGFCTGTASRMRLGV